MDLLNKSILYYLLLLAIPVIIHLFNFRKHKKLYFSTIFFLKKIEKENKAKYQIRRWIILFNRILAITLIIIAFALPYINRSNSVNNSKKIGFYIDNSFSMSRTDSEKNQLIEYAKSNTKQIINELNDDHQVLILTNDFQKIHQKWYSPEDAIEIINSIEISKNTETLETIINRYNNAIDTLEFNILYLFSDFQRPSETQNIINNQYTNLKIGILSADDNNNISIDSCYFSTPIRKKNEIENLRVSISNHGLDNQTIKGKLTINNQQTSIHNIDIPANSTIEKDFHYLNPANIDTVKGILEIEDNSLEFDNKLYFSYSTNQQLEVSVIYQDNLSLYLSNIFSDSLFKFSPYSINQIDYEKLYDFKLIIIDQVEEITHSLAKRLEDYVNHGGNIFIFLNKNINPISYNEFFNDINVDRVDKWQIGEYQVEYINYKNMIFRNVFKQENKNINLPTVNAYFSMVKNKKSQMRKVLNFLNNDAFISEYLYKKGRIFICNSDLNSENNNFANHALFIPCLYNAALMNLKNKKLYHTIENETIIDDLSINQNDLINLKKEGSFDMTPSIINTHQRILVNFQDKIPYADNYNLVTNQTNESPISFNYNRSESTLIFLNKHQVPNIFDNQNIEFMQTNNNIITKKYQENQNRKKLEYFFIISAIILLIIELILLRIWKM